MTIEVDLAAVRAAWARDGERAAQEVSDGQAGVAAAKGGDLGDLQPGMDAAGDRLSGVLGVVTSVIGEFGDNIEGCLAEYARTEHRSAGRFHELA